MDSPINAAFGAYTVKTMETKTNEHLSAVFDDEAGAFENRRILDELANRQDMQETWSRYAVIGEAMRQAPRSGASSSNVPVQSGSAFLAALHERMAEEEPIIQSTAMAQNDSVVEDMPAARRQVWLRPVAGLAAAATIAAVAVFAFQDFSQLPNSTNQQLAANVDQPQPFEAVSNESLSTTIEQAQLERQRMAELQQKQRMQRYLASHIEYASRSTIAPTIRTVAYGY